MDSSTFAPLVEKLVFLTGLPLTIALLVLLFPLLFSFVGHCIRSVNWQGACTRVGGWIKVAFAPCLLATLVCLLVAMVARSAPEIRFALEELHRASVIYAAVVRLTIDMGPDIARPYLSSAVTTLNTYSVDMACDAIAAVGNAHAGLLISMSGQTTPALLLALFGLIPGVDREALLVGCLEVGDMMFDTAFESWMDLMTLMLFISGNILEAIDLEGIVKRHLGKCKLAFVSLPFLVVWSFGTYIWSATVSWFAVLDNAWTAFGFEVALWYMVRKAMYLYSFLTFTFGMVGFSLLRHYDDEQPDFSFCTGLSVWFGTLLIAYSIHCKWISANDDPIPSWLPWLIATLWSLWLDAFMEVGAGLLETLPSLPSRLWQYARQVVSALNGLNEFLVRKELELRKEQISRQRAGKVGKESKAAAPPQEHESVEEKCEMEDGRQRSNGTSPWKNVGKQRTPAKHTSNGFWAQSTSDRLAREKEQARRAFSRLPMPQSRGSYYHRNLPNVPMRIPFGLPPVNRSRAPVTVSRVPALAAPMLVPSDPGYPAVTLDQHTGIGSAPSVPMTEQPSFAPQNEVYKPLSAIPGDGGRGWLFFSMEMLTDDVLDNEIIMEDAEPVIEDVEVVQDEGDVEMLDILDAETVMEQAQVPVTPSQPSWEGIPVQVPAAPVKPSQPSWEGALGLSGLAQAPAVPIKPSRPRRGGVRNGIPGKPIRPRRGGVTGRLTVKDVEALAPVASSSPAPAEVPTMSSSLSSLDESRFDGMVAPAVDAPATTSSGPPPAPLAPSGHRSSSISLDSLEEEVMNDMLGKDVSEWPEELPTPAKSQKKQKSIAETPAKEFFNKSSAQVQIVKPSSVSPQAKLALKSFDEEAMEPKGNKGTGKKEAFGSVLPSNPSFWIDQGYDEEKAEEQAKYFGYYASPGGKQSKS
ncbi:hypothetical protein F4778DRAFT_778884 [Xylariomycetidae sp. FL2044]|nr:hypothetical protein F4778DRAFT_778884 [Xylariomycetidae sp. FL2044]